MTDHEHYIKSRDLPPARRLTPEQVRAWWAANRDRYRELDHEDAVARGQVFHTTHHKRRPAFDLPRLNGKDARRKNGAAD